MAKRNCSFTRSSSRENGSPQSFDRIPEDVLINILSRLEDDPRHLARLACVSHRLFIVITSCCWKLRCMKLLPTLVSELVQNANNPCNIEAGEPPGGWGSLQKLLLCCPGLWHAGVLLETCDFALDQKLGWGEEWPHLASEVSTLSREQGTKLLASRFRADILYICDWSGCVHTREERKYKLFRGVFKNFKNTHVWRNLNELKAKKVNVCCAFCSSASTWDMVTSFCLRRSFEYHDDGEPVVRAFVCENGHVAGAWTDRPTHNY
ncbi:hypothetical protein O6H91_07G030500 [Diphasiastrum complanatum]|uniref:Uncharacterized protein n=1 Tax=Diphasiastrum complanatum TaxID=34168 RepID=A0ACC2D3L0_DIPCM|nr:hypothetical protein O6H91_07G030500 [Diphasiastrum complanatum]